MKLKQWLITYKNITYNEYKKLPDIERWVIEAEFKSFNRKEQIRSHQNWRDMTEEESKRVALILEEEKRRYETNLKIGGIDGRGNYIALHYRHS